MADNIKIVDKNKAKNAKQSPVWEHFGFVEDKGVVNPKLVACKICRLTMPFSGNTTNLRANLDRKHWDKVKHLSTTPVTAPIVSLY
jgi:hypothetical protein